MERWTECFPYLDHDRYVISSNFPKHLSNSVPQLPTDTDVYSKNEPKFRSWLLWLVGNIPGNDVCKGEVLAEYIGAGPAESSGKQLHGALDIKISIFYHYLLLAIQISTGSYSSSTNNPA